MERLNKKFPLHKCMKITNFQNITICAFPQGEIDLTKLESELYYEEQDQSKNKGQGKVKKWKGISLILLIGSRLGIEKINPIYLKEIFRLMKMFSFNGLLGARKNRSYFFIGSQQDDLIFLDPHKVQVNI